LLAAKTIENLEAALEQFREVATALGPGVATESDAQRVGARNAFAGTPVSL
jgi:hypothetical protein